MTLCSVRKRVLFDCFACLPGGLAKSSHRRGTKPGEELLFLFGFLCGSFFLEVLLGLFLFRLAPFVLAGQLASRSDLSRFFDVQLPMSFSNNPLGEHKVANPSLFSSGVVSGRDAGVGLI